ncbi:MAG: 16S rRNA (cytosine(1402)-N(4))-methyltransferase RsmH [Gemmataceae bacterium]
MKPKRRSTPAGEHRPVLLREALEILDPQPGRIVVDCTLGFAGHSVELLRRLGPTGLLIGLDTDPENLPRARERLGEVGHPFELHHANFAGLDRILAGRQVHAILADLGMSSMQVDNPDRGFSYARDGVLDMRMDRSRGKTLADLLQNIDESDLSRALAELGDEPNAEAIAAAIVQARAQGPIETTRKLSDIIRAAAGASKKWRLHPSAGKWNLHPAARSFQALRILLNRELASLTQLLRLIPECLLPSGRAAVISFHSGEDRLVKRSFQEGFRAGRYSAGSDDCLRAGPEERLANPRSRSAKLRWVQKS